MQFLTITFATLLPLIAAQGSPGSPDFYNTVAEIYSGPNCEASSLVWADPIFGNGGTCQLLDRNNNTPDIISYKVLRQYPGCTGKKLDFMLMKGITNRLTATLYTDNDCLSTAYPAPVGACVTSTDGKPFVKAFVQCPFSK